MSLSPHPFAPFLASHARRKIVAPLIMALCVLCGIIYADQVMTAKGGVTYLALEYAGTEARAKEMLDKWDAKAKTAAGFSAGIHFLACTLYTIFWMLLHVFLAGRARDSGRSGLARTSDIMAWGMLVAGLVYALLHVCMLALLFAGPHAPWPQLGLITVIIYHVATLLSLIHAIAAWLLTRKPLAGAA